MRILPILCLAALLACITLPGSAAETASAAIRSVLDKEVQAWNQADLRAFVAPYATHCTLVGSNQISETTREQVLTHYEQKYPSPAAMGKLTFSNLTIQPIDADSAVVTGRWHLDRETAAGGGAGGVFSLVFQRIDGRWQIILDHTS